MDLAHDPSEKAMVLAREVEGLVQHAKTADALMECNCRYNQLVRTRSEVKDEEAANYYYERFRNLQLDQFYLYEFGFLRREIYAYWLAQRRAEWSSDHSLGGMTYRKGWEVTNEALGLNEDGDYNVASGFNALYSNTIGTSNIAIGPSALWSNTTASGNTAIGDAAMMNTTGGKNIAVGGRALYFNTTGSNNIAIGSRSALNVSGANSNNIHIGSQGLSTDNGAIRIGDPTNQTAAYIAGIYGSTSSSGVPVYVNSDGRLGTQTSSLRFKEQIRDMGDSTSPLMKLRPVTFL